MWQLLRHGRVACAGSLWYASAVALASVTKMYRANEDGRAMPVLLLAPVAASGEPLIPVRPALQRRLCAPCFSPVGIGLIWIVMSLTLASGRSQLCGEQPLEHFDQHGA